MMILRKIIHPILKKYLIVKFIENIVLSNAENTMRITESSVFFKFIF